MPSKRLCDYSKSLLNQFKRKFEGYPLEAEFETHSGFISSPLRKDSIEKISDEKWLEIMMKDLSDVTINSRNMFKRSDHEHFSQDIGEEARMKPSRFAKLALRIPRTVDTAYMSRILSALTDKQAPSLAVAEDWEPAAKDEIEAVLGYVGYVQDSRLAMEYCRTIEKLADLLNMGMLKL